MPYQHHENDVAPFVGTRCHLDECHLEGVDAIKHIKDYQSCITREVNHSLLNLYFFA